MVRAPVRRQHERDVAHVGRRVLVADEHPDRTGRGDGAHELTQVGPVLEGSEDPPQLVAAIEFRRAHHVQESYNFV